MRAPGRFLLRVISLVVSMLALTGLAACQSGTTVTAHSTLTPLQAWLRLTPMEIAHRGGDADWTEGTAFAYRRAAAWNPSLALEVPVWRTADGVWVVSEDRTTGRVFDANYAIPATTWATLSTLHTRSGGHPMARLLQDVLQAYGDERVLFVDDKADADASSFLDLLGSYGGPARFVVKSYWQSTSVAAEARHRGYTVWGYYDTAGLATLSDTASRFDLLGLPYSAPEADFSAASAAGKPVIAHVVATRDQAAKGRARGARGLMVSGVQEVVDRRTDGTTASSSASPSGD